MRYYTCVSDHKRLLEPPFKVIRHQPGYGVLFSFGEEGIAPLREVFEDVASTCYNREDGRTYRAIWLWDDSLANYELTESTFEPLGFKQRPNWRRAIVRSMKVNARRRVKAKRYRERDTALCAKLTQPTVRKGRVSLFFPRYRNFLYGKPGGESCFRFRFFRAPGKKALPLLIFLHGAGGRGYRGVTSMIDFAPVWPGLLFKKCHVLVPQLPLSNPYAAEVSEGLGEVIAGIPHVDRSRIYLMGLSMGGCGAVIECRRHPERYAACVTSVAALRNLEYPEITDGHEGPLDENAFDALAKTPLWLGYSRDEKSVNEPLYDALNERGANVKHTFIKGLGHGPAGPVFWLTKPWAKWLFSH